MVIFQSPTSWWTLGGVCSGKHWYAKIIIHTYIKLSYIYIICTYIYIYSWWANSSGDSRLSWFFRYGKIICELKSLFCCSTHPYIEFTVVCWKGPFQPFFFFQIYAFERSLEFWGCCKQDTPQDAMRNPHRIRCPRVFMKVYFLKFGIPTRERNVIIFARWLASGG